MVPEPASSTSSALVSPHLAPRRADYERVFTGVNLKTDIISGTLFNSSGTLFWAPETIDSSGTLFRQFDPNLLATLYLTPTGDPSNPVHSFQSTYRHGAKSI